VLDLGLLPVLASLLGQNVGGGNGRQSRGNGRSGQARIRRRVAIEPLILNGRDLFFFVDADGIVLGAEGEAGVVALFLGRDDLAVETAEEVNESGIIIELGFRVVSAGEFLEEDLREASGGGLKTDLGEFRSIVAAEEIQHMILVEAILEDVLLGEGPFEVTAHGPVGDIPLRNGVAGLAESGDNVFVGDGVPEHVVDHIALNSGETGDAAIAADFARRGR